jgi:hypothetical protein
MFTLWSRCFVKAKSHSKSLECNAFFVGVWVGEGRQCIPSSRLARRFWTWSEHRVFIILHYSDNSKIFSDDHAFSLLHWASKEGHVSIAEMLLVRGARVNATNMGDDTSLHLAASHGHRQIVLVSFCIFVSFNFCVLEVDCPQSRHKSF